MLIDSTHARTLLRIALAAIVLAVFTYTRADPDLWGHVQFGGDTVRSHTLSSSDPYSFSSDRPWVNHEWLAETAMYLAYAAVGGAGLIALKVGLLIAMMAAVVVTLRAARVASVATDLLMGLVLIGTVAQANHVRPQLFSLSLFALLLAVLRRSSERRSVLLLTIPILAVWANLHGGWIVGAGVLA